MYEILRVADIFLICISDLYQPFIDANRIENPERRMLKLKRLIHELPEHHFETFKHLAKHLNTVAVYGDVNRVSIYEFELLFSVRYCVLFVYHATNFHFVRS